jgi:outer membrane lipoprotein carrier protein
MRFLSAVVFVALGTLCPALGFADELACAKLAPLPAGTLDGIEKGYQKISSLEAQFVQTSYFIGLDRREISKGEVEFQKPGRMNWAYSEPDPQRFVSDGRWITFYQPKLNQASLTDFTNTFSTDVPVTFLLGIGSLKQSFEAAGSCKTDAGLLISLKPKKEDASLSSFILMVDAKELTPLGAKVVDLGGNETTIRLLSPKLNAEIPASHFAFEIPKGVDIIDNRGAEKSAAPVKEETLVK